MTRHLISPFALCCLLAIIPIQGCTNLAQPTTGSGSNRVNVYFSPRGGGTAAIVKEIDGAKYEVLVLADAFTSKPILQAVVNARKRGVNVQVVLDKSQRSEKNTEAEFLSHAHIPTYIDSRHAVAHNKIILIDSSTLITGSFSFTKAAEENNAENLLVINGKKSLVGQYIENFELHKAHSDVYRGK
jgi:phosphatidylserine/phosphatidylglycerophosphate/cardiolipin synthase-like enzyme